MVLHIPHWLCRGWGPLWRLRQRPYSGAARFATENGEAGSAADAVREHWARQNVSSCSMCSVMSHMSAWEEYIFLPSHQYLHHVACCDFICETLSSMQLMCMQVGQPNSRRVSRRGEREDPQDVRSSADSRQSNASMQTGSQHDPLTDRSRQLRWASTCPHAWLP
jgi:hypothetical protein